MQTAEPSDAARRDWMSVMAKAPAEDLSACFKRLGNAPSFTWLRPPEIGAVMVRGRAGATGAPFNLGEMTVTRCSLRLEDGSVGHAYVPGRDRDQASKAAMCDAMLQGAAAEDVRREVVEPLREAHDKRRAATAGEAEKTRVDFFTMVRGEG
ncbi:MAG: phosphonate C-P lyase system protein PhnG [Pseudomonadota bacterium]